MSNLKVLDKSELKSSIAVLVGTRPSIIKMSPIIRELETRNIEHLVIHAGQHYSYEMDKIFFKDLNLRPPKYTIEKMNEYKLHGEQTAAMLEGIEKILIKEKPKILLVCGDANFNLSGALAARKLGIPVAHLESGLRSNDWLMPEEHNRVLIDHISEILFCPTKTARKNLVRDNVKGKIFLVGNLIVDAVYQNILIAKENSKIINYLCLENKEYAILTTHREENVDDKQKLLKLFRGIKIILKKYPQLTIVFPIHPRTRKRINDFSINHILEIPNLHIIDPIGYLDFLLLLSKSEIIITDSGGIQEEATILHIPCITIRENTERPETIEIKANMLVGTDPNTMLKGFDQMIQSDKIWDNPFGDGKTAQTMVDVIIDYFDKLN